MNDTIVTLTTIPSRLRDAGDQGIRSCIDSLVNQSCSNYQIHFNLPSVYKLSGEEYVIPEWLTALTITHPFLKIYNTEDVGPITKMLATIERVTDPDTIIIVVDDDMVYHPNMVQEHIVKQQQYVNCALGYDGLGAVRAPVFNDVRDHYVVSIPYDVEVKTLQHYKSVSYRRKFFEADFFSDFLGKTTSDDILVSCYMKKQNIKKMVLCYEPEPKLITVEEWRAGGGTTTFPVVKHTSHEGLEGCTDPRAGPRFFAPQEFITKGYT